MGDDIIISNSGDIGSLSSSDMPLGPGFYIFKDGPDIISILTTLYLSGVGTYIFYIENQFIIENS